MASLLNSIFICNSETAAAVSELLFHREGRNGKRHLLMLAPCGSIHVSMKTCCCHYVSSRKRLQIGATQKIL